MALIPLRLLIIDDSEDDSLILSREIVTGGYECSWERIESESALREALPKPWDVIIIDFSMPQFSAVEALRTIKEVGCEIPCIVVSGQVGEEAAVQVMKAGARDYIQKGNYSRLIPAIQRELREYEILKDKKRTEALLHEHEEKQMQMLEQLVEERTKKLKKVNKELAEEISIRKRVEEELIKFRVAIDSSADSIFLINYPDMNFYDVSSSVCVALGYSRKEIKMMMPGDINIKYSNDDLKKIFDELIAMGNTCSIETAFRSKKGFITPVEVSFKSVQLGTSYCIVGVARDITERRKAAEAVEQALQKEKDLNKHKTRFLSIVSHDFKTPLTVIQATVDLLDSYGYGWPEEKLKNHYKRIKKSLEYMTQLIEEVLIIGRVDEGRVIFKPDHTDILAFTREMFDEIRVLATEKHTLEFICDKERFEGYIDDRIMTHILNNILSNALKYSPNGGKISFAVSGDDMKAVFTVSDEGLGIPQDEIPYIFESFHRGTNIAGIKGTGLGLGIVKKFVDIHGGKISVTSEVDKGSTFSIEIPINKAAEKASILLQN